MTKDGMSRTSLTGHSFALALTLSLIVAFIAWEAPQGRMPIDIHAILWLNLPLAALWLLITVISAFRFHLKALWLLLGAPLVLYWPLWMLVNGIPVCYWRGNCI
jgi:hypothetical protein